MNKKIELLRQEKIFNLLSPTDQEGIADHSQALSFQQLRQMALMVTDLKLWQIPYQQELNEGFVSLLLLYKNEQNSPLQASPHQLKQNINLTRVEYPPTILGKCPVSSPKTRCCGLLTLDVAQGCGFGCAYCAIPSFYGGPNQVRLPPNLKERLEELKLDPNQNYHIGTGQSADSLLYCNSDDADALIVLANRYPDNLVLEFKSKSANLDSFLGKKLPPNLIFSWSLNPQSVIDSWEAFTSSLEERLNAAETIAKQGRLIGFHLHPLIPFQGYQQAYSQLAETLIKRFKPSQLAFISLGTLTFSKTRLKFIRELGQPNNIFKLPLQEIAGKYSIPFQLKKELFGCAIKLFIEAGWTDCNKTENPFFYLCMEDEGLWQPVLGYQYKNNEELEQAMYSAYRKKIAILN